MKSSLTLAWTCSIALGRDYGDFRPGARGTVIVYGVEDDRDEQRRRLSATLRQFEAVPAEIRGRIIITGPKAVGTLLGFDSNTGSISETSAMAELRGLLLQHRPDALILDPLVEIHTAEENNNIALRAVVARLRALAAEFNMAVIILHHTRKGTVEPGDPDAARGASSLVGAGRIVLTLCTMTETDADLLAIAADRKTRSAYLRLDDAKQNYAAIGDARWFEKIVYMLDNGEHVPAAVPWTPPELWGHISTLTANVILDEIEAGPGQDRRYSPAPQAKERAAWPVVKKHVECLSEKQAKSVIRTWCDNRVLEVRTYRDSIERREVAGLYVNPAKRPG
jgi:hypothetical protein